MLEKEIFKRAKVNIKKLLEYNFKKENNEYIFRTEIVDKDFEVVVKITEDGSVKSLVIDKEMNEEYTNVKVENTVGEFVNRVKDEYIKVLKDIKDKCFTEEYFVTEQANRITDYIIRKYNSYPEFLWKKSEGHGIFRNSNNNKWFGIIMDIDRSKIEDSKGEIEIINLKLEDVNSYLGKKGFYKAYHMDKENWISVILDDTLKDEDIEKVIDKSYNIINEKTEWIIPANPKYYDVVGDFETREIIEWKQSSNINVGDIIYLYVAEPYSAILYKCVATEVNIPYDYKDINITISKLMKIKLLKKYKENKLTFKYLNEIGIKSIRGPRKISKEISEKINKKER